MEERYLSSIYTPDPNDCDEEKFTKGTQRLGVSDKLGSRLSLKILELEEPKEILL